MSKNISNGINTELNLLLWQFQENLQKDDLKRTKYRVTVIHIHLSGKYLWPRKPRMPSIGWTCILRIVIQKHEHGSHDLFSVRKNTSSIDVHPNLNSTKSHTKEQKQKYTYSINNKETKLKTGPLEDMYTKRPSKPMKIVKHVDKIKNYDQNIREGS